MLIKCPYQFITICIFLFFLRKCIHCTNGNGLMEEFIYQMFTTIVRQVYDMLFFGFICNLVLSPSLSVPEYRKL